MNLYELLNYKIDRYQRLPLEERRFDSMREYITDEVIEQAINKRWSKVLERELEKGES